MRWYKTIGKLRPRRGRRHLHGLITLCGLPFHNCRRRHTNTTTYLASRFLTILDWSPTLFACRVGEIAWMERPNEYLLYSLYVHPSRSVKAKCVCTQKGLLYLCCGASNQSPAVAFRCPSLTRLSAPLPNKVQGYLSTG